MKKLVQGIAVGLLISTIFIPPAYAQETKNTFCAVEIGARGIKGRLFSVSKSGDKIIRSNELPYSVDENPNLIASGDGKNLSPEGIDRAALIVSKMLKDMKALEKDCQVFVVGSSSIGAAPNRSALATAVVNQAGVAQVDFVSVEDETKYGFMGSIPKDDWPNTMFLDIGSGNLKLGAFAGKDFRHIEIPFGTSSLMRYAAAGGADFFQAVDKVIEDELRPTFRKDASKNAIVLNQKNMVIIGGAAWAIATFANPGDVRRHYVKLSNKDFEDFRTNLKNKTWMNAKPPIIASSRTKEEFEKQSQSIRKIFSPDDLVAASALIGIVINARASDGPIYFSKHGTWLFGYAQDKFNVQAWGRGGIDAHT